ncbi:MAG TPA: hypothetical protein VL832_06425 [Puia sp.]|jgi:hypothetical protein|nr:hypothetical protein [Puia sp.]
MKGHPLIILLILVASLVPAYYFNKYLQRVLKPRESAGRLFLFMLANFVFIIVYTIMLVGMIVRINF